MNLQPITTLTLVMLQPLLDSSVEEGYDFIQRLWDEYQSGKTTFSEPGAVLLGIFEENQFMAIGGLHPDTYLNSPDIGRIRHIYVLPAYRRHGIGKQLVQALITQGSDRFKIITLRTLTEHGQAFYKSLGFSDQARFASATHWLETQKH